MLDRNNIRTKKNIRNASTIEINAHYFNRKNTIDKELQMLRNKK